MAYITNRNIRQHYKVLETIRAGLSLLGTEVKSIKTGKGSLKGAKILIRGGEAFLVGATVPPHQEKNAPKLYEAGRTRRLLLNKNEIKKLYTQSEEKQLTLLPLTIYNCNQKLKIDIGVASKKTLYDKREQIKKQEDDRLLKKILRSH